ncbi:MAG: hypothetical protein ACRD2S_06440 [Terriglobales bacterium]
MPKRTDISKAEHFASAILIIGLLWAPLAQGDSADSVTIELQHDSVREQQTKVQLERLLNSYDLTKYTFTRKVTIDEKAIPHSHPVLTLHTRHLNSDDELLSTYVHEQLHWYLSSHEKQTEAAENDLRKLYPKVPAGYPEGAQDEEGTYLHLVVCYLEMQADRKLIGAERTSAVMNFWATDHYTWVYKTVIHDEPAIAAILNRENLIIE